MKSKKLISYLESNRNRSINLLKELISIDTTNINHGIDGGHELNGQEIIIERFKELGLTVESFEPNEQRIKKYREASLGHDYKDRPNVIGCLKGAGNGKSIILNGHIDTMPFDNLKDWVCHPLKPKTDGNRLYGRGACDMKGGLAAFIMAIEALVKTDCPLAGDVIIESVVDEEGGGNGTLACVDRGYQADAAIVAEPTESKIMPAHMGWVFFKLDIEGKPLHSGMKWLGVNAIEKAIKIIKSLEELEREWMMEKRDSMLPPPTINIGTIKGGMAGSVVPDHCRVDFGAHFLPQDADEEGLGSKVEQEIIDRIMLTAEGDPWLKSHKPKLEKYQEGSPFKLIGDNKLLDTIADNYQEVLTDKAEIKGCEYGCDARLLYNYGETPTVMFGPGSIKQAHSINEFIEIDEYLDYIKVLAVTILDWTENKA